MREERKRYFCSFRFRKIMGKGGSILTIKVITNIVPLGGNCADSRVFYTKITPMNEAVGKN